MCERERERKTICDRMCLLFVLLSHHLSSSPFMALSSLLTSPSLSLSLLFRPLSSDVVLSIAESLIAKLVKVREERKREPDTPHVPSMADIMRQHFVDKGITEELFSAACLKYRGDAEFAERMWRICMGEDQALSIDGLGEIMAMFH